MHKDLFIHYTVIKNLTTVLYGRHKNSKKRVQLFQLAVHTGGHTSSSGRTGLNWFPARSKCLL